MPEPGVESFVGRGGLLWRALPAEAAWVRSALAADPDGVALLPGATVVKRNPVRTVVRVPRAGGGAVFVKRFATGGLVGLAKYAVVPSRAEAEWRAARALREAGIPSSEAIAVAEARRGPLLLDAFVVLREVKGAMDLVPWMFRRYPGEGPWPPDRAGERARLLERLGGLVRRLHDAGFVHPDLHGGNLLLSGAPDAPEMTIIDLHTVRRRAAVAAAERERDLVRVLHSMITATDAAERAAVARAYDAAGPAFPGGDAAARVERRIAALEGERLRSRTRRRKLLGPTGRFDVARRGDLSLVFLRRWGDGPFLCALEEHRRAAGAAVLKRGGRSTVTRVSVDGPDGPERLVVKETRVRGAGDLLRNALRPPRAVQGWIAGNGLWQRHLDCAEPRAVAVRGRWPLLRESFLVMEDAGGGERYDLRALRLWGGGPPGPRARAQKREDLERFGRFVGDLHAAGVYHGDLKAVNVFVREKHGAPAFCLVDYDRVAFGGGPVPRRRRLKNLAQLAASVGTFVGRSDRLRFYRAYASRLPGAWEDRRPAATAVAAACARKIVVVRDPIE